VREAIPTVTRVAYLTNIGAKHGIAGDVATRAREARHQAYAHRITDADHYDRNRRRRSLGRFDRR